MIIIAQPKLASVSESSAGLGKAVPQKLKPCKGEIKNYLRLSKTSNGLNEYVSTSCCNLLILLHNFIANGRGHRALHSKELILVFVRLGRLVTPRLVHLLARHIEYEEQIDGVCRKQKDWNLSGKCIANAGLSHQDIFGYESGPIYQLIPEILANIGDKRAIPVLFLEI